MTLDFGGGVPVGFYIVASCVKKDCENVQDMRLICLLQLTPLLNALISDKTTGMEKNEVIILIKPK